MVDHVTRTKTHQEFINKKKDPKTCNQATKPPFGISLLAPGTGSIVVEFEESDEEPPSSDSDGFSVFGSSDSGVESMPSASLADRVSIQSNVRI